MFIHIFAILKILRNIKMKKTLMILAHPNLEMSVANKIIAEKVRNLKNIEVRDITKLYPDFKINVEAEQEALINVDRIIFQYPIQWYNMPPILKQWFDQVLTYGFAYGGNTYNLDGKEMMASVTTGGTEEVYAGGIVSKILFPLEATASFCKMKYISPIVLHGIMVMPEMDTKPFVELAKNHANKLIQTII